MPSTLRDRVISRVQEVRERARVRLAQAAERLRRIERAVVMSHALSVRARERIAQTQERLTRQ